MRGDTAAQRPQAAFCQKKILDARLVFPSFVRQAGEGFLIVWWAVPGRGRPADARLAPVVLDRLGGQHQRR
jgi:hypothetical protein